MNIGEPVRIFEVVPERTPAELPGKIPIEQQPQPAPVHAPV